MRELRPLTDGRFAAELRRQREARGWSQSRLAAEAGYEHSYISRLEAGKREPSRFTVEALCDTLGLDDLAAGSLLVAAGYLPNRAGWVVSYQGDGALVHGTGKTS